MRKPTYDEVVAVLKQQRATCAEIKHLLTDLGFDVRRCASGNHHSYMHPRIRGFLGSNYDCGHGKNPVPLQAYFRKILKVLTTYETDLRAIAP